MFVAEERPDGYAVVTEFLRNAPGEATLIAAGLPAGPTEDLSRADAEELADRLNRWIEAQQPGKKARR